MVMAINYRERIITLWAVFLLGTLFHTQLGLMPLFHGLSVIESQKATTINDISGIMWLMLGFLCYQCWQLFSLFLPIQSVIESFILA